MSPPEKVFSQVLTHWTMDIATSRTLPRGLQGGSKWQGGRVAFVAFCRLTEFKSQSYERNVMKTSREDLVHRQSAPLATPTDLKPAATKDIAGAMNAVLADVFALYLKTKNFHWHMSGPHFRDYHLLLDEQADQLFAMTDAIAERVRKIGGSTLKSVGHISRMQRVKDNDADYVEPQDMLAEVREDNKTLAARLREAHNVCDEHRDIATASLIEVWIDETERRTWFLYEAARQGPAGKP
jgi:starvation-inducible DNA-binding protein